MDDQLIMIKNGYALPIIIHRQVLSWTNYYVYDLNFFLYWLEVFSGFMALRGELPSRLWKIQGIIGHARLSNVKRLKGKNFFKCFDFLTLDSPLHVIGGFVVHIISWWLFYCSFFKIGYVQNWYIVILPNT